jgi:hypothetical protein
MMVGKIRFSKAFRQRSRSYIGTMTCRAFPMARLYWPTVPAVHVDKPSGI